MPIAATAPLPPGVQKDGRVPPLDAELLARIAAGLRAYQPLDVDSILDDVDAVVGEHPADTVLAQPAARLHATLQHLVAIVVSDPCRHVPAALAATVDAAQALVRDLRSDSPQQYGSISQQRRTAVLVLELLDQTIESEMIKGER